jgi:small subunit ribosomal protein S16
MSVKIRLQRHGRKKQAYYHIVVADARAPRDGKFIENLGFYNPNTNPATIELNLEKSLQWLNNGAQPTETCRAILSYRGALHKMHLQKGVSKGALTQEQADAKFENWLSEKTSKIENRKANITGAIDEKKKTKLQKETEVKEARAKKLEAKNAALAAEAQGATEEAVAAADEDVAESPVAEAETEAPAAETETPSSADAPETPAAEEETK